jgi:excisionase family DNA binding protein
MPSSNFEPLAVSLRDAAGIVGLSTATLRRLAAAGRIRLVKVGGKNVVPVADLHRLIGSSAEADQRAA